MSIIWSLFGNFDQSYSSLSSNKYLLIKKNTTILRTRQRFKSLKNITNFISLLVKRFDFCVIERKMLPLLFWRDGDSNPISNSNWRRYLMYFLRHIINRTRETSMQGVYIYMSQYFLTGIFFWSLSSSRPI